MYLAFMYFHRKTVIKIAHLCSVEFVRILLLNKTKTKKQKKNIVCRDNYCITSSFSVRRASFSDCSRLICSRILSRFSAFSSASWRRASWRESLASASVFADSRSAQIWESVLSNSRIFAELASSDSCKGRNERRKKCLN